MECSVFIRFSLVSATRRQSGWRSGKENTCEPEI